MIIRNSMLCLDCNVEIESKYRHDFQECTCGAIAVDGGNDYLKRSIMQGARYKDTSIVQEDKE